MNPFKLLNVSKDVSPKEIINAAALALRERKFSAREVAEAQRDLLNPSSRAAHAFLHFIEFEPLFSDIEPGSFSGVESTKIERLSVFDEI